MAGPMGFRGITHWLTVGDLKVTLGDTWATHGRPMTVPWAIRG